MNAGQTWRTFLFCGSRVHAARCLCLCFCLCLCLCFCCLTNTCTQEQQRPTSISITHQTAALVPSRDGWAALPLDILVQILHHVPPKDRFQHCSLVNSDWAAACVESTDSISLPGRCYNLGNLQAWMVQHGSRLTTISVAGVLGNQEVTLLPCANLRQLDLADVTVQVCC